MRLLACPLRIRSAAVFDLGFVMLLPMLSTVVILTSYLLDEIPALNDRAHAGWDFWD